jgi:hypothetical protein
MASFYKGQKFTKTHRKNISIGLTGRVPWNKGKHHTRETIEKIRKAQTGKKHTDEHKRKIGLAQSGEKSRWWKGGITIIHRGIRHSKEYRWFKIDVLKRDGGKCVKCGTDKQLEVDHIKPLSKFPHLAFKVSNGRTLCRGCHTKTKTYGWKLYHKNK